METSNSRKRKRQAISLAEKQSIIEASNTKPKTSDLVTHLNNKYSESTIRTILKDKDKILKAIDDGASGKRSNVRKLKHSNSEEALLNYQLHRYIEENADDPKATQFYRYMKDFLHQEQMKHLTQVPITQFMPATKPDQPSITQFFI